MNKTVLVIKTNKPVAWQIADNLCGFCIGYKGYQTSEDYYARFFEEMHIDPLAKPYIADDGKMKYPNPFGRYLIPLVTPCCPWRNPRYGSDGRSVDYVDYESKTTLSGRLVDPSSMSAFKEPAFMSVALFFTKPLYSLLFGIVQARAINFFAETNGATVESVGYEDRANETPQIDVQKMKV